MKRLLLCSADALRSRHAHRGHETLASPGRSRSADLRSPEISRDQLPMRKRRCCREAFAPPGRSAAAIFGLIMAVADIGPTTLWIGMVKVTAALGISAERWRSPAGQRWRPWSTAQRTWLRPRTPYRRCGWSGLPLAATAAALARPSTVRFKDLFRWT